MTARPATGRDSGDQHQCTFSFFLSALDGWVGEGRRVQDRKELNCAHNPREVRPPCNLLDVGDVEGTTPTLPSRRVRFLNRNASRTRQKSERREGETVSLPQIVNPTHSPCFVVPNCDACSLGPSADTKSRIDAEVILSSPSRKCGCAATRSSRLTTSGRGRLAHPLAPDARRASEHAS